jgi:perosamine synthetase
MHVQPAFLNMGLFKGESYPVATGLSERGLYLPSGSGLKSEEIDYICTCLRSIASGA